MHSRKMLHGAVFAFSMFLVPSSAIAANDPPAGGLEPTTFGGRMVFLGLGIANIISDGTCVFAPQDALPPDTRCVAIPPAPSATTSDFQDIGSIYLSKGSARSIIWPTLTYNIDYQFNNTTGAPQRGIYRLDTYITIESDALLDPALVDAETGLPYNGKIGGLFAPHLIDRTLSVGERIREHTRYSGVGINAFNTDGFFAGLPAKVVKKLFDGPMTIRYGLRIKLQNVDFTNVLFGLRLTGDKQD